MNHNISEAVRCAKHAQHYDIMYLAQAVGELLEYQNTRKLGAALGQALRKQPEPEPVALETVYETIIHWDEGGGKRSRRELARRIVSLYTTPQRKPLTDEQKVALCKQFPDHLTFNAIHAIEAAYGIQE